MIADELKCEILDFSCVISLYSDEALFTCFKYGLDSTLRAVGECDIFLCTVYLYVFVLNLGFLSDMSECVVSLFTCFLAVVASPPHTDSALYF